MKNIFILFVFCSLIAAYGQGKNEWTSSFEINPDKLSSTGANDYFILKPGYQLILEGREDNEKINLIITVLDETKNIDGYITRVVEERESADGNIVEISRNYFAIDTSNGNVYYFGEDVAIYEDGEVKSHSGEWHSGTDDARFGLMMPGKISIGQKYYQEFAPDVAMDRAEIISISTRLKTPAGTFYNCLKTEETTPLEPKEKEYKIYAKGIGLIKDGSLLLTKSGYQ